MTDSKRSKSNIAARFPNPISVLSPIGVFWDIENCHVPKGKSAIAFVQNIRDKFFKDHREAEFMCVCDINKESKVVIQELLSAQVTIVYISATSKNAADDKLKQCMKRFVDTHGAPATLLLISGDVNFAFDLSDFRHRHNIRIILIHQGHAHPSLVTCAHEHYTLSTIAQDLPDRSPVKSLDNRPCELIVSNLPVNRKGGVIKKKLSLLSTNCGGKVVSINGSNSIIRFSNADFAARAKKRMDEEIVFGNKISVNFRTHSDIEYTFSPPKDHTKDCDSSEEPYVTCSSADSSYSLKPKDNINFSTVCDNSTKKFTFPPPPVINEQNSPILLKEKNRATNSQMYSSHRFHALSPSTSMPLSEIQRISDPIPFCTKWTGPPSSFIDSSQSISNSSVMSSYVPFCTKWTGPPSSFIDSSQSISNSSVMSSDAPFCTKWTGPPSLSIDSSQSVLNDSVMSSDVSYPELHVSNLDPTFEVNEMKKILLSLFSQYVRVIHISMSLQPDGSAKATMKVPSLQSAQYAMSRLHRWKIGDKRILISRHLERPHHSMF